MEKMVEELRGFEDTIKDLKLSFNKHRYIYSGDNKKLKGENDIMIIELREIVLFSIPQVESRIDFGYGVLKKHKQILY